ncbi:MAG TPA: PAS domain-containing protein [Dongiaceae bacterium]|jgi:hypothetical protein|nr:PAS domain-containing protein [Dongiaceae bacterium]
MPARSDFKLLPASAGGLEPRNPRLARLFDYWAEKRAGRRMPARADIDPLEMREWLGNLLLAEFFGSVEHYKVRIDGTNLINHGGGDRTGKGSEIVTSGEEREMIRRQYGPVLETAEPAYFETQFTNSVGRFLCEQKLLLPLSEDGVTVNMVLAGIYYRNL